jgi:diguanylate cyclase (GGDEF)-like protein/PAS domain S-box-containing protein
MPDDLPTPELTLENFLGDPAFFRDLLNELYDGIAFVDNQRVIRFWSRGAERLSGYAASEVVGRTCGVNLLAHSAPGGCELCGPDCPLMASLTRDEPTRRQVRLLHKDGRRIVVDLFLSPLTSPDGRPLGCVEVFRDAGPSVALEQAFAKLEELAMADPLTGIANRRHLDAMLDLNLRMFDQTGVPVGVVMADLDHFKRVNDRHGHLAGDRCLEHFARCLQAQCRQGDVVGRFGGEEFLVLLPRQDESAAAGLAFRLREQLARTRVTIPGGSAVELRASFGVTQVRPGDTRESLLARADAALYDAKAAGRNRVVTARSPGEVAVF